jgi:hypothetical protein
LRRRQKPLKKANHPDVKTLPLTSATYRAGFTLPDEQACGRLV